MTSSPEASLPTGPPLVRVVRDGAADAVHGGHVAIVSASGELRFSFGAPDTVIYPRSTLKPFQAAAALGPVALRPPSDEIAVMAASHLGARAHQAAVMRLLSRAGLTAAALRCPRALPLDRAAACQHPEPTRLAHNCSGKHAGFLLAAVAADADHGRYLQVDAPVQLAARDTIGQMCGTALRGPGVDGCGAPAWRMPLRAVGRGFAALAVAAASADAAVGSDDLTAIAVAMRTHPGLVGGDGAVDTELMRAERAVIAKRGAEGALAMAVETRSGPVGVAIKVSDGASRALGPVAVAVLDQLGLRGPASLRRPDVLGGGVPRGAIEVSADLAAALAAV